MADQPALPLRLQQLLDQIADQPDQLARFTADPLGMARAAGIGVVPAHIKYLLEIPDATDQELVEALRARVARPDPRVRIARPPGAPGQN